MNYVLLRLFLAASVLQSCLPCRSVCPAGPGGCKKRRRSVADDPTMVCSFGAQKLQELNNFSFHDLGCHKIDDEHIKHADNLDCGLFSMHANDKCWSKPNEDSMLECAKHGEEDFITRISYLPAGVCSCREAELASFYIKSVLGLLNCDLELQN